MPVFQPQEFGRELAQGLLDLFGPKEAEAFPVRGAFRKVTEKIAKGEVSRAAEALKGLVIKGKAIKNVVKGKGNWRYLIFEDETYLPVTKDQVNALARAVGTRRQMEKFAAASPEKKVEMALKSFKFHAVRQPKYPWERSRRYIRGWHEDYLKQVRELAPELVPETVFVEAKNPYTGKIDYFQMPKAYAEVLQQKGLVRIVKRKGRK